VVESNKMAYFSAKPSGAMLKRTSPTSQLGLISPVAYYIFAKTQESGSSWGLLGTFRNSLEAARAARGYRQTLAASIDIRIVEAEGETEAVKALEQRADEPN